MYYSAQGEINQTTNVVEMYKYRGYIIAGEEIVIPHVDPRKPISFYMLPLEDIDEKYKPKEAARIHIDKIATTPGQYYRLASNLLAGLVKRFEPVFYEGVTSKTYPNDLKLALQRYLQAICTSPDARYDHQLAYMAYVMDLCCSGIERSNIEW
jgi:hypothetical protein